jgi:UDP-N-acetylglucosamine 2-epimerase (non-hydrolysing)
MTAMHVLHVAGGRPDLLKVAPVLAALSARGARQTLVHTGQPCDLHMADAIVRELCLPAPDLNLGVAPGSHAEQTAQILVGMERCLRERRPDLLLVYGDAHATLAAALAAAQLGIPVGHVDAGVRCRGRRASEEVNRAVTGRLATWHFTGSADADDNLVAEGVSRHSIRRVGSVMIDTLARLLPLADAHPLLHMFGLVNGSGVRPYALATLHDPVNVDDETVLAPLLDGLAEVATDLPVVFPVHPRTRERMPDHQLRFSGLLLTGRLPYLQFLGLQRHAAVVITDSGAVQEETTYLGVPCLTVLEDTERRVTVEAGTNRVVGRDASRLKHHVRHVLAGRGKRGTVPALWDGRAALRIAEELLDRPSTPAWPPSAAT